MPGGRSEDSCQLIPVQIATTIRIKPGEAEPTNLSPHWNLTHPPLPASGRPLWPEQTCLPHDFLMTNKPYEMNKGNENSGSWIQGTSHLLFLWESLCRLRWQLHLGNYRSLTALGDGWLGWIGWIWLTYTLCRFVPWELRTGLPVLIQTMNSECETEPSPPGTRHNMHCWTQTESVVWHPRSRVWGNGSKGS